MPGQPSDKWLDDLIDMLKKHLEPTLPILAERFTFHCCSQGNSESIAAYVAELKRLTTHCKFEAYLDEAFRDRFVFGQKITAIQKKLLAVETAQSMESVDQQAKMRRGKDKSQSWRYRKCTRPAVMKV